MLGDLVTASNAKVHAAFADKGGYVCGGEEDQCYRKVLDEGDVETGVAVELNVGAGEEVEGGLL